MKVVPVADREGKRTSRVSAVYDAAPRRSFVVALKDVRELWEVSYDPKAADIHGRAGPRLPLSRGHVRARIPESAPDAARRLPRRLLLRRRTTASSWGRRGRRRQGRWSTSTCSAGSRRSTSPACRTSAPASRWQRDGRTGDGDAESEGRRGKRDRREGLEGGEADPDAGPGLLHAQPRGDCHTPGWIR